MFLLNVVKCHHFNLGATLCYFIISGGLTFWLLWPVSWYPEESGWPVSQGCHLIIAWLSCLHLKHISCSQAYWWFLNYTQFFVIIIYTCLVLRCLLSGRYDNLFKKCGFVFSVDRKDPYLHIPIVWHQHQFWLIWPSGWLSICKWAVASSLSCFITVFVIICIQCSWPQV